MRCKNIPKIRPSRELWELINYIRAKYMLAGKTPPSIANITKAMTKKIPKDKLYHEEFFIRL